MASASQSPVDPELLAILVCPEDHSALALAPAPLVEAVNAAIARRALKNREGKAIEAPIEAGLVRADGAWLYPIIGGIPVMIVEEAIPLAGLPRG